MRLALLSAVLLLAGCPSEDDPLSRTGRVDPYAVNCTPGLPDPGITQVVDIGASFPCDDDWTTCNADYTQTFLQETDGWVEPPADCDALIEEIYAIWDSGGFPEPEPGPFTTAQLQERVIDAIALEPLLDGLDSRSLTVTTVAERSTDTYSETELIFTDPLVGSFQGLLLTPPGDGPFPIALQLPGHHDDAAWHRDMRYGGLFPEYGIATLILSVRAYDAGSYEDEATRAVLCAGFSMQTIRVYEALVALRFLRGEERFCADRRALYGHSGGAVALNTLVRADTDFQALVTDFDSSYVGVADQKDGSRFLSDENAPGLVRLRGHIIDWITSPIWVLQTGYGVCESCIDGEVHPDEVPEFMFDFLTEKLADDAEPWVPPTE